MAKLVDNQVVAGSYLASHCCSQHLVDNFAYLVSEYQKVLIRTQMQMEESEIRKKKELEVNYVTYTSGILRKTQNI